MVHHGKKFFIVLLIAGLMGCAGTSRKPPEPQPEAPTVLEETSGMDENFDPLTLNDDDITFPAESQAIAPEMPMQIPPEQKEPAAPDNEKVDGFRVQIFSTKNLENATQAKAIAEEQFATLNLHCYLEFDSPYYKVRVGDFKTREEAEHYRDIIRSMGYPNAWIVKTKVFLHPGNLVPTSGDEQPVNEP